MKQLGRTGLNFTGVLACSPCIIFSPETKKGLLIFIIFISFLLLDVVSASLFVLLTKLIDVVIFEVGLPLEQLELFMVLFCLEIPDFAAYARVTTGNGHAPLSQGFLKLKVLKVM